MTWMIRIPRGTTIPGVRELPNPWPGGTPEMNLELAERHAASAAAGAEPPQTWWDHMRHHHPNTTYAEHTEARAAELRELVARRAATNEPEREQAEQEATLHHNHMMHHQWAVEADALVWLDGPPTDGAQYRSVNPSMLPEGITLAEQDQLF